MTRPPIEERLAQLSFPVYRKACKAEHTRRLGTPWYIDQGDVLQNSRVENTRFAVWSRQVNRYAQWFLERDGLAGKVTGVYSRDGDTFAMIDRGSPVRLPEHVAIDYVKPADVVEERHD
jgi:hypothetical protein